jgi:hypothetical protein
MFDVTRQRIIKKLGLTDMSMSWYSIEQDIEAKLRKIDDLERCEKTTSVVLEDIKVALRMPMLGSYVEFARKCRGLMIRAQELLTIMTLTPGVRDIDKKAAEELLKEWV